MAKLVFHVQADYEEVIKLRNEIEKLKKELKSMDATQSPAAFNTLNTQLSASTKRMDELVTNAAKAGAEIDGNFKKKIFDASQTVNGLTEKIIAQKSVVKDVEADVKRLGEAYRIALKRGPLSSGAKLEEYNAARKALDEEKAVLFDLTQQQAEARLSVKRLRDEYALYNDGAKEVIESNNGIVISWKKALAIIGGAGVLKALGSEMIRVRGEFQAADTAIQTLLVSKAKTDALMLQVREYAKISPLEFSDVTQATQQMLGFNIEAEKVPRFISAIGDISMGETPKFNSLALAFSQMSATGKLIGNDLNQMINAGFNPLQIMSERTGKSIAQLKDEMSKGAISAEMVQQAFIDATSAGGKFYNMSENASKTINGQLSMVQDAMDSVFNELGQKSEGVIMSSIQMTTSLIENYETIGKVLAGLVVTYGTYRTAVMLTTLATGKHTIAEIALTNARVLARKAQLALNAAMLTNPYVLLATAVVGLGTAMWAFGDSTTAAEKTQRRFNEQQKEAAKQEQEHKQRIDELVNSSRDIVLSDLQRGQSLAELRKEYPKIFSQYDIESIKLADILELKRQIAEEDSKRAGERVAKDFKAANKAVSDYENTLSTKQINGGKLTQQEINKLKELRSYRDQFLVERGKGISEQFISSLKNVDISKFDEYISELEKRIKGQGENGKIKLRLPIDVKGSLSDEAIYDVKDIKSLIDTAKSTKQTRIESEKNKTTYQQDLAAAKADWEKAKKGYEAILKDQKATSEKVKSAHDEMQAKEKAYKDLGGETGSSLTKRENQAKKEAEERLRQQEQLAEQLLSLRQKNQQDEINLMKEGTEKKLAQIDLDYQKELDAIEKQREEWKKAQKGKLTDEQETQLSASEENSFKAYQKDVNEVNKAKLESDRKAWQEYFIEFGNYQEKRKNLIQKYDDEIAQLKVDSPEYAIKVAEKDDTLEKLDEQYGKSTRAMADLFEDASNKSVSSIQAIIDKYELLISYLSNSENVELPDLKDAGFTDSDIKKIESGEISIKDVTDAVKNLKDELKGKSPWKTFVSSLTKGIDTLKNAGVDTGEIGQGITDIGNAVTSFAPALSEFGSNIANIFGFDDSKITGAIDALGGLGQTAAGVGQIMAGDIVGGAMSAVSGISTVVSAFEGMFGADYSQYNKMKEEYDALIDVWDTLIEKKQEYIDIDYGIEAAKAAAEATKLVENNISRVRQLVVQLGKSGSSIGSHSLAYRVNDRMDKNAWSEVSKLVGQNVTDFSSLFSIDASKIGNALQSEKLVSVLTEVNSEFITYIQDMEKYADQLEEIARAEKEAFTGMSFDSFWDSFVDTLADLDSTNKDFADNFEKYLQNAVFSSLVANQYKDRIQALYNRWAAYAESDDDLSKEEVEALRAEQERITEDMLKKREELMQTFGWASTGSYSQQASSKGFQSMSQDTGEELNGRFTAIQASNEEIKNLSQITNDWLARIYAQLNGGQVTDLASENKSIVAGSYSPTVSVAFPDGGFEALATEVSALRGIVDDVRFQSRIGLNGTQLISESTSTMARNSTKILTSTDDIKQNVKTKL